MIVFFDPGQHKQNLLPFTYLRPIAELRLGILKICEKWQLHLSSPFTYLADGYLQAQYPFSTVPPKGNYLYLNATLLPEPELLRQLQDLAPGQALMSADELLAYCSTERFATEAALQAKVGEAAKTIACTAPIWRVNYPWQLFEYNRQAIAQDFELLANRIKRTTLSDPHTAVYGKDNLLLEEGAQVKAAVLDAEDGPIFLGKNSKVSPGAIVQGAHAICQGSQISPGAKLRGDTTIGPYCKVGGEVSNSVFIGYANKGHDGYLGNAVIGEWCNLGADTNASNLKNNYTNVNVWNYTQQEYINTGLQFCGLLMGDHSKCGINTMFNTGTVVGVSSNIFDSGFPPKFIPSFAWGGSQGFATADLAKMKHLAHKVMQRRDKQFGTLDKQLFDHVFEVSRVYRKGFSD